MPIDTVYDWCILRACMAYERIRFNVSVTRKNDAEFREIAQVERRSKSQMHELIIERIVKVWKENPNALRDLQIVRPAGGG